MIGLRRGLPLVGLFACTSLTTDLGRIIGLEVKGSGVRQILVGDTLQLQAVALNARGDSVPDATVLWAILDVDSGQVSITLDTASGLVVGIQPGQTRVQARVETLRSEPILINVSVPPATPFRHEHS